MELTLRSVDEFAPARLIDLSVTSINVLTQEGEFQCSGSINRSGSFAVRVSAGGKLQMKSVTFDAISDNGADDIERKHSDEAQIVSAINERFAAMEADEIVSFLSREE